MGERPVPEQADKASSAMRTPAAADIAPILVARGITKSFPGVLALSDVDFDVRPGEVNALLGENGAGKSTLIKLMAGFYAPDGGDLTVNGVPLAATPTAAHRAGV